MAFYFVARRMFRLDKSVRKKVQKKMKVSLKQDSQKVKVSTWKNQLKIMEQFEFYSTIYLKEIVFSKKCTKSVVAKKNIKDTDKMIVKKQQCTVL